MTPRIETSVVVPTYNGADHLHACLASVAVQDLRGVEVLVNDDASDDDTLEIAASFADDLEHLRVERNPTRLGAVGNVNRCLELARGRWVKPVFQDDLLEPGALRTMLDARQPGVPVVVGDRTYLFEDGVPTWQREACVDLLATGLVEEHGSGPVSPARVASTVVRAVAAHQPQRNVVGEPVTVLLDRRAALKAGGFHPGYAQLWDYELVLRLAMRRGLVLVDEPVAVFRVHSGSETARNLADGAFATNVVDRLRILVTYASDRAYRPVREAAAAHEPPIDLTALATGSAWAARRRLAELPDGPRARAEATVEEVTRPLHEDVAKPWAGSLTATRYAVELLHELADDVDSAVEELYRLEPLAVDLADPPDAARVTPEEAPDGRPGTGPEDAPGRRGAGRIRSAARSLRANQWWNHMLGPLVAMAYLQVGWREVAPWEALGRTVALLTSAIALAAYGYVVNDASDVEVDLAAGKPNSMARLSPGLRVAVAAAFALFGALPWTVVRLEPAAMVVLAGIYLVPLAYSPRPLRLKEHRLLGPVADASNAFVLPALFTVALFAPLGEPSGPAALMVAGVLAWASAFGLRAILLHQVDDAPNDRASGTTTFVTTIGEARAVRIMRSVLFPLEMVGLVLLGATVAFWAPWLVGGAVVGLGAFHGARVLGVLDRSLATTTVERGLSLYWTQVWPALSLSLALAVRDLRFLACTGLVLVLFGPRLRAGFAAVRSGLANELRRWRLRRAGQTL